MDGDPDLEPGDEDREHDGTEPEEGVIFPRYGINQARGPLNQS
ncbi:hypothetical protein NX02_05360 [Sphingomonas sanxanigenens DSM 19645 = NX02]|uniref:Uncharacterized protein n=2 Tax=Sphingomonas sanxanigenens TaxID=397260 RepID=W0A6U6_9SPHN|nr:hypothetical protein NX02_05360 [Sphingomonas sanxanigenens DSM 19645 = NX02]